MNEHLEDLMYRAGLTAQGCWDSMDSYDKEAIERFAELIIRECAQYIEDKFDFCGDELVIAEKLKEHFGVEQ